MTRDPFPYATSNEPVATLRDVWRWTVCGFVLCATLLLVQYVGLQAMDAEQQRQQAMTEQKR